MHKAVVFLISLAVLCSMTSAFQGDGTYYNPGLGACGLNHGDHDLVAAVDQWTYGSSPNPNKAPICGRYATIHHNGKSVRVQIVDKCMGCKRGDIDMSPTAFARLAPLWKGRIKVSWNLHY